MRSRRKGIGALAVPALALALLGGAFCGAAAAQGTGPTSGGKNRYKLPQAALAGLPNAIVLERLPQRLPLRTAPRGIQYFQSPLGLAGMWLEPDPQPTGSRLRFAVAGEWTFVGGRRFQQLDTSGNRLIIEDGKVQLLNAAGQQIGALEGPEVRRLFQALLRLTM